ncbi:MAG: oligosaccharide flippase family protein [Calditrichaeota bacterium]|nr:oligosaccharide flippase family protein [Calditrichota bacterium]MCB9391237.1 oligosaccharide flippase family protein [Calditrichota bacterium]
MIYGLAHILTRSVTFLLLPYYSYRLSAGEYGELALYYLFLAVAQTFYVYGLDIAYLRFYNLKDHGKSKEVVNGTVFLAVLVSALSLSGILLLLRDGIGRLVIHNPVRPDEVATGVMICAGILFFDTLGTFPFLKLRSDNRPLAFSTQKLINVSLNIALNVWMVGGLRLGVMGVLYANLISSVVTFLLLLPSFARSLVLTLDGVLLKSLLTFGLPNVPTYLFVMVVELADRKALEIFRGVEEAGLYSAGYKLGMFMGVVNAAFRFAWQPFFLKHAEDSDAPRLFSRTLTYYLLVACALLVSLTALVPPLVTTDLPVIGRLISSEFSSGLVVFPVILAAHIFDGVYANLMVGIYIQKQTRRLPAVTGAAAVFTIAANLLLVPTYGMMAAAWITLAAFMIQAVLLYFVIRKCYPLNYEWGRIGLLGLVTTILTLVAAQSELGWTLRVLVVLAFPLSLLLLRFPTQGELAAVRRLYK